jgi:hypothetical protein
MSLSILYFFILLWLTGYADFKEDSFKKQRILVLRITFLDTKT